MLSGRRRAQLKAAGEAYDRALGTFAAAKQAYAELQAAHQGGRFHDLEAANFRRRVEIFRAETAEVRRRLAVLHGEAGPCLL